MIGASTKFENKTAEVLKAKDRGAFKSFSHAAARIRIDAVKSIKRRKSRKKSSKPGEPVFTHVGLAKQSEAFHADKTGAVIGAKYSVAGRIMETHEKGLTEEGRDYPERPVIVPALQRNLDRFAEDWRASIS